MNLGTQTLVNKQSMIPSSSGASRNSTDAGDGSVPDQFPAGLRVLVVDDDPTCLMILEKMLRNCNYDATKCNRAEVALSLLRENKNGFDVVISDVHMPDMDGFKLLEHIGLEMDLPVIMMSADDSKSVVMKGVIHGACDYLIKPVRIEALRNIWQHVVRKKKHEWKDVDPSPSLDQPLKQPEDPDYSSSANEGHNWKNAKRRKDDEDEAEDRDDSSSLKKPRVVWSVELHQQFVAAVNQLGVDKAVPKKILDLMNVPGLTRENVASHLQKYRLYLRRLSGSHQPGSSFIGNSDGGFGSMSPLSELDLQALSASGQLSHLPAQSLATLQAAALGSRSTNLKSPIFVPLVDQRNIFSFENPKLRYLQGHNGNNAKQMNLLHGTPTTMEPMQLVDLQHSFGVMNGQSQSILTNGIEYNQTELTWNTYRPMRSNSGISYMSAGNIENKILRQGFVPSYDIFNDSKQNKSNNWDWTNNMQGRLDVVQHNYNASGGTWEGSADNCSQRKSEGVNYGGSHQDDLLTVILTQQQQQEGVTENEFGFDWYGLDNLPV